MLVDQQECRSMLLRIVARLTRDVTYRQDLMQEGLLHLWLLEERKPGQTRSWYLQNCQFHLDNYILSGRSVDSLKRTNKKVPFCSHYFELIKEGSVASSVENNTVPSIVGALDLMNVLSKRLSSRERKILCYLADGRGACEIGKLLKISHPAVIKHRQKIAAMALRMGVLPLPLGRRLKPKYNRPSEKLPLIHRTEQAA